MAKQAVSGFRTPRRRFRTPRRRTARSPTTIVDDQSLVPTVEQVVVLEPMVQEPVAEEQIVEEQVPEVVQVGIMNLRSWF